jgi:membrane fusion protein, heavy metal efflux system
MSRSSANHIFPLRRTNTMLRSRLFAMLAATMLPLTLAACGGEAETAAEPAAERSETFKVTHYTDGSELFVEYRPLIVGKETNFAAHLSWIGDYRAVNEGTLTAELVWPDGSRDQARMGVSDTPGIFRPVVKPSKAGKATLRLVLEARGRIDAHELGQVTVFGDAEKGTAALPIEEEDPNAIGFTKEVQWRIPFLAEPTQVRALSESVPVTVDARMAPQAEAIVSAPVDGIVRASRVPSAGMFVRRGQTLATISSTLGGGEDVATLGLAISEAEIARDAAAREVSRMNALVRAEAVPQRRLDEARTELRLAEARIRAAQARRSAVAGGGPGVPVVAPISGEVLEASLVQGQGVTGGQQLMRLGNPAALWLVARVPESLSVQVGRPGGLELVLPDRTIMLDRGSGLALVQQGSAIDPQTRTMPVIFAWNSRQVRPGQRLQGRLLTGGSTNALTVPASAILNEGGQDVVYVQVEGETFERRPVTITRRSGSFAAVEGQLKAGERVVTRGAAAVRAAAATPGAFGEGHAH